MEKHIYTNDGSTLLDVVEAEPECGKDFCDTCGDCLACYGEDECPNGNIEHYWIEYAAV